jgi:hypothetical protein
MDGKIISRNDEIRESAHEDKDAKNITTQRTQLSEVACIRELFRKMITSQKLTSSSRPASDRVLFVLLDDGSKTLKLAWFDKTSLN